MHEGTVPITRREQSQHDAMKTDSSSLHFYILRSMQYFLAIRRDTADTPYTRTFACVNIKFFHSVREYAT